eukprot:COSAG01_NODE_36770_length_512_cov_10.123487_1_plen_61_part_00
MAPVCVTGSLSIDRHELEVYGLKGLNYCQNPTRCFFSMGRGWSLHRTSETTWNYATWSLV